MNLDEAIAAVLEAGEAAALEGGDPYQTQQYPEAALQAVRAALRDVLLVVHRQACRAAEFHGIHKLCGDGWDCSQARAIEEALA